MFNIARMLNTKMGQIFISIILGLGLATLFRKVCTDKSCLIFNGPVIEEVNGKTFQYGEYCQQYELFPAKCDSLRKTVIVDDTAAKVMVKEQTKVAKPTSAWSLG